MYKITVKINNKSYTREGETAFEALKQIKIPFYKTHGFIIAKKGKNKFERLFPIFKMKKTFASENNLRIMAKNLELMVK